MTLALTLVLAAIVVFARFRPLKRQSPGSAHDGEIRRLTEMAGAIRRSALATGGRYPELTALVARLDSLDDVVRTGPRTGWTFDVGHAVQEVLGAGDPAFEAVPDTVLPGLYEFLTSCRVYLRHYGPQPEIQWVVRCEACGYALDEARCDECGDVMVWTDPPRRLARCADCGAEMVMACPDCGHI